jgi:hypothetical protein
MMQGITDNLHTGFEAMWHPQEKRFVYNYGVKWVSEHHTLIAHYIPIAPKDTITVGYITKPNKHLNLFGELKLGSAGTSDTCLGFKMAFNSGLVSGTINSAFKATSTLTLMMDQMLQAQVNTIMDFADPEKSVTFGIGLSFGGG